MQSSIRIGLVAGAVGLVLVVIGSAFSGYCALALPLVISGAAGYSSAQRAPVSKGYGARNGLLAGTVSGGIVFHAGMISQAIMTAVIRNAPAYSGYFVESNPLDVTERIFFGSGQVEVIYGTV
jgi:hypothetical protein